MTTEKEAATIEDPYAEQLLIDAPPDGRFHRVLPPFGITGEYPSGAYISNPPPSYVPKNDFEKGLPVKNPRDYYGIIPGIVGILNGRESLKSQNKGFILHPGNVDKVVGDPRFMDAVYGLVRDQNAERFDYYDKYNGLDKPQSPGDPVPFSLPFATEKSANEKFIKSLTGHMRSKVDSMKAAINVTKPGSPEWAMRQKELDDEMAKWTKAFKWSAKGTVPISDELTRGFFEMNPAQSDKVNEIAVYVSQGLTPQQAVWDAIKSDPVGNLRLFAANAGFVKCFKDTMQQYLPSPDNIPIMRSQESGDMAKKVIVGGVATLGALAAMSLGMTLFGNDVDPDED